MEQNKELMIKAANFMAIVCVNINNKKLSDKDFRRLMRNLLPIVKDRKSYKIKTYAIKKDHIECLICGSKSYNINDKKNLYCGKCKKFHELEEMKTIDWG